MSEPFEPASDPPAPPRSSGGRRRLRAAAVVVLVLSLVGLAVSSLSMLDRLGDRVVPVVYFHDPILDDALTFASEPVAIERLAEPDVLRVSYRGDHVDFTVVDEDERLPGLLGYREWFRVMPMFTGIRSTQEIVEQYERGEAKPRMVVAARYTPEGYDEGSWGMVRRKEWRYRIAELHPPPAEDPVTVVEKTYEELDALLAPGPYTPPELVPSEEVRERDLWMHYAMRQVTPTPFFRAKDKSMDTALAAMSWTWPVAGICVLGVAVSGLTLASTAVRRRL